MRRRRRLAMTLALAAGAIGLVQIAGGLWIPAKVALAQVLLERAWHESLAGGTPARPWPWADTRAVARLTVAARSMIVLSGGSGAALAFGPSLVAGSAAPGGPGLAVIAGHRDTQFALLREVAPGQIVELETADGGRLRYRVAGARITARPELLVRPDGARRLALVTCWPFDAVDPGTPERFVLFADPL